MLLAPRVTFAIIVLLSVVLAAARCRMWRQARRGALARAAVAEAVLGATAWHLQRKSAGRRATPPFLRR
jgi:hypothetical protein